MQYDVILLLLVVILSVSASDNLALLSGTLRTYQRAGCDEDFIILRCPPGTSISIQIAQYGTSAPTRDLCRPKATQSVIAKTSTNTSCLWENSLQTVVEICQKKRQCKFKSSPKTFGGDPCPGIRKYVEVAYKCRPYEFRSKVACQNEEIQLKCNPNSRIAIYSASYGRTEYESIQCPQPQGVREETCLVSYGTETVMQLCHGKRSCDVSANINTFGNPCRPESRMYLKVVYTCVPRKVFKEQFEGQLELDELTVDSEAPYIDEDFDNYDTDEFIRESAASPSSPNIFGSPQNENITKNVIVNIKSPPYMKSKDQETNSQEWLYLYLILSITAAVVLCLILLIGRLLIQKQCARRGPKFHANSAVDHSLPSCFTDDISEIDADIDLNTSLPVPAVAIHLPTPMGTVAEVVRYPHVHTHTLQRTPDTDAPRSLSSASNTQYYYG